MKACKVTISNEAHNCTSTKYNNTLTGFTSEEAASKAAKEALRDAAGEMNKGVKVFYSETLNAWVLANNGNWLLVAKVEEAPETAQPETKQLTVKRSDWNETAKRLECAGWYYIGTPTATGKTIYRRGNSEIEIIIEEPTTTNTPATMNANETAEYIAKLRHELQQYHDNASKGGQNRRRNMILLRWDIGSYERQLKAIGAYPRRKSINGIMNQANRLMSVCNAVRNFKRADVIRAIAFRYYDNIRACAGRFNYNNDSEYSKEYSRAQYMNA